MAALTARVGELEAGSGGRRAPTELFTAEASPAASAVQELRDEVHSRRAGGASLGARGLPGGGPRGSTPVGSGAVGGGAPPGLPPPAPRGRPTGTAAGAPGPVAGETGDELASAIRAQTAVLAKLRGPHGSDDEEDPEDQDLRLPGAKGAAAMDVLIRLKDRRPEHFSRVVSASLRRLAAQHPGASLDPVASARAYLAFSIPFGSARTLGYLGWGLATAWDELSADRPAAALATLSLLLVALEQAALDESNWGLAWLLSLLPEPPWTSMSRRPDHQALRPYSKLADTRWVSSAVSSTRDVERIRAARKGSGKQADQPGGSNPKGGKEAGGKGGGGGPKGGPSQAA